ncbi:unnamed protein product [Rotaria sp. Silwood2]|nr:unnamed protein product [Rotaria sp. Silwood2]CAF2704365.1 unnamed protein product [Rotaria sp. Silwood2]CAF3124320.1 unnamed protein product [Rotaria sp. Silwood2]CAF3924907.1 unnamed protein product [Rotaria sp. Silwood2]CAF3937511.1 unnamed protein product [Rotaria sp. Silwood2]
MSVKTVNLLSWSSTILLIFILCFVKQVQISNAYAYCQYYKPNTPWPYFKECPFTCCPKSRSIRENTTCCNPPTEETAIITIFGYRWWTVFLCASCIIIALILLANINKRLHIFKNFKNFNSAVNPASPYTISTNDSNNNDVYKFSTKDDTIILEQHPPCYKDVAPSAQPPYASVNPPTKTDLE